MATTAEVLDRIASIQEDIVGVQKVFAHDEAPNKLQSAHLPAFINVPGPVVYDYTMGHTATEETRTYRMLLYVCPVARPVDVARRMDKVEPFFRDVIEGFKAYYNLNSLTGVSNAYIESDDGLDVLEYADGLYAGIEFKLGVVQYL